MNMATLVVTDANFEEIVLKSELPVIVDLWAEWCGPCQMITPHIEALATEYENKAKVCSVDIDSNPEIPNKFSVLNIPTILFFKDGKQVDKIVGAVPKKIIQKTLEKYL